METSSPAVSPPSPAPMFLPLPHPGLEALSDQALADELSVLEDEVTRRTVERLQMLGGYM